MTSALERVMTNPGYDCDGPVTEAEIDAFEAEWGLRLPADLRALYLRFGPGSGATGDGGTAGYMTISSLYEITGWERDHFPADMLPFGSNGGPEHIVYSASLGYGLTPTVGHPVDDFLFVADTLEGFMQAAEDGTWFDGP